MKGVRAGLQGCSRGSTGGSKQCEPAWTNAGGMQVRAGMECRFGRPDIHVRPDVWALAVPFLKLRWSSLREF